MRSRCLHHLAHLILRHPWLVIACGLLLTLASVALSTTQLTTNANQDDLLSEADLDYHRRYKQFLREFGDQEFLYVVVEAGDRRARARDFVDALVPRLQTTAGVHQVFATLDLDQLSPGLLANLSPDAARTLGTVLHTPGTRFADLSRLRDLSDLLHLLSAQIEQQTTASADPALQTQGFAVIDQFLADLAAAAQGDAPFQSPWRALTATHGALNADGYLGSQNGRFLYVLIMPEKDYATLEVIGAPLRAIRAALQATRAEFPEITAGLTGRPVLAADELESTTRDMTRAVLLAFAVVTLIFVGFFRALTRPLLAVAALVMGICWTYGFATLAVGSLNLLSSVFVIVLVGAGIDFGLHVVARYQEELAAGHSPDASVRATILETGRANLTACITTAVAFWVAICTDFLALRELGLIGGVGICLCLLAMLTVLPAMLLLRDRHQRTPATRPDIVYTPALRWLQCGARAPKIALALAGVLTIAAAPGVLRVRIDHNLLNLQPDGLESVTFERRLLAETDDSTWQTVLLADTPDEAARFAAQARALPTVGTVESLSDFVPARPPAHLATLRSLVGQQPPTLPKPAGHIQAPELLAALTTLQTQFTQLADQALRGGRPESVAKLETMAGHVATVRQAIIAPPENGRSGNRDALARLGIYQQHLVRDWHQWLTRLHAALRRDPAATHDLPDLLRNHFIGQGSPEIRYAVYVYPKDNIWKPAAMARFVNDVRRIDPHVTGGTIEVHESSRLMERSFRMVSLLAILAVVVLVLLDFRNRVRHAGLALLPLGLGLWWMLGVMGFAGIPFTLANFFAVPMLIGLGVDNGVQMLHRVRADHTFSPVRLVQSTGQAVLLTSLTTLVSFGTLIFAAHRGLRGLGLIMALGTGLTLIASVVVLPALLALRTKPHSGRLLQKFVIASPVGARRSRGVTGLLRRLRSSQ